MVAKFREEMVAQLSEGMKREEMVSKLHEVMVHQLSEELELN